MAISSSSRAGASLIELAIYLLIAGLFIGMNISPLMMQLRVAETGNTWQELKAIKKSLRFYAQMHGKMPCPASLTLAKTDPAYGSPAEDCDDGTPPAGVTRIDNGSGAYVLAGAVPVHALGMSREFLTDPWGNYYYYVVTEDHISLIDLDNEGIINVEDGNSNAITSTASFVVGTHGNSVKGATAQDTAAVQEACDATVLDGENCDFDDALFIDTSVNETPTNPADFYDDYILWGTNGSILQQQASVIYGSLCTADGGSCSASGDCCQGSFCGSGGGGGNDGDIVTEPVASIPTTDLIVHVDARDPTSYPGTGSTWYDLSGNDNHLTLYNSPTHDNTNGTFDFNGVNQFAYRSGGMSQLNFTLGIWVKFNPSSLASYYVMGNYVNNTGSTSRRGLLITGGNSTFYTNPPIVYRVGGRMKQGDAYVPIAHWDESLVTDKWYFLSATKNGNTVISYLNGIPYHIFSPVNSSNSSNNLLEIARLGSTGYADIKVSEAFYYAKALTDEEMLQLYDATKSGKYSSEEESVCTEPTVPTNGLALHLDGSDTNSYDGTGTTWYDISGNDKHATISGATFADNYFDFDGNNDLVSLNTSLRTSGTQSWVFWVYPDRFTNDPYPGIFGGSSLGTANRRGGLALSYFRSQNRLYFDAYSNSTRAKATKFSPTVGSWTMYTLTYDAGNLTCLYENKLLVGCDATSIPSLSWSSARGFTIGRNDQNGAFQYFDGRISRVLKYNRVLSFAEISDIYSATDMSGSGSVESCPEESCTADGGNCTVTEDCCTGSMCLSGTCIPGGGGDICQPGYNCVLNGFDGPASGAETVDDCYLTCANYEETTTYGTVPYDGTPVQANSVNLCTFDCADMDSSCTGGRVSEEGGCSCPSYDCVANGYDGPLALQNSAADCYYTCANHQESTYYGNVTYSGTPTQNNSLDACTFSCSAMKSGCTGGNVTNESSCPCVPGEALFTTTGARTWKPPSHLIGKNIHILGIGGGGGGYNDQGYDKGPAGGGGALCYKNSYTITATDVTNGMRVVVGSGGSGSGGNGGDTTVKNGNGTLLFTAGGGTGGTRDLPGIGGTGTYSSWPGKCNSGGNGGDAVAGAGAGGGGAAGYYGNGGKGGSVIWIGTGFVSGIAADAGTGGGGGGGGQGWATRSRGGGGGGGVGVFGAGTSGSAGAKGTRFKYAGGGGGGSGGSNGSNPTTSRAGNGGAYGGGGGGASSTVDNGGRGGNGAVRIIWGDGRSYPNTNTNQIGVVQRY